MLDISAYCRRIDHHGDTNVSIDTLNALTRAHSTHIPFENISVLLQQPIDLNENALFNKLVVQQRGGYCFEQNGLFLAILKQLGFNALPLAARVRLACSSREELPIRTHLMIKVSIDGKDYITDVGVGGFSLTRALELSADRIQETEQDSRRFQRQGDQWYLQVLLDDHWQDVYQFGGETMPMVDRKVANWYTSTHPESHFTYQLSAAIANNDSSRSSLKNNVFTIRWKNGNKQQTRLMDNDQLLETLNKHFSICLNKATDLFRFGINT